MGGPKKPKSKAKKAFVTQKIFGSKGQLQAGQFRERASLVFMLFMLVFIQKTMTVVADCGASGAFFGAMGASVALIFANLGAAYGTAKAAVGVAHLGVAAPHLIMRGIVPVVMAGILGIYGLIVAVIISSGLRAEEYTNMGGYVHLGAGMAAGLATRLEWGWTPVSTCQSKKGSLGYCMHVTDLQFLGGGCNKQVFAN